MEVKLGVKMDITPPVVFTFLLFYLFTLLLPLLFLFYLKRCKNTEKPTKSSHYEC